MAHAEASKNPFARRPRPWYKRATAAFHYPQGGIPQARVKPRQVDCGPLMLSFLEPSAAYGESGDKTVLDRVSLDAGAFTGVNYDDRRAYHKTIELAISNWIYHLPRWRLSRLIPIPGLNPPYAVITAYWQLEQVKHGIRLKLDDMAMLEDYLRHDYTAYFESEGGRNWKMREEAYSGKTITGVPRPQYQIDDIIENHTLSPPPQLRAADLQRHPLAALSLGAPASHTKCPQLHHDLAA